MLARCSYSKPFFVVASIVASLVIGWALVPASASANSEVLYSDSEAGIDYPDFVAGRNGFALVGWSPEAQDQPTSARALSYSIDRVAVRVRRPGHPTFGAVKQLGAPGSFGLELKISENQTAFAKWADADGSIHVSTRRPNGAWSGPEEVFPGGSGVGTLSIGPDGTAAIALVMGKRLPSAEATVRSRKVFVAVKSPKQKRFGPARLISRGGGVVGNYLDLEAGSKGRVTIAWSGWCPIGPRRFWQPARIVDISRGKASTPRQVADSECPTFGIDLAGRPGQTQYLLVDGSMKDWNGVRVSKRPSGKMFGKTRLVSEPGEPTLGAHLSVSLRGRAIVVWRFSDSGVAWEPSGFKFTTSLPRGSFKSPKTVSGIRGDQVLISTEGTPHGGLAMAWQHIGDSPSTEPTNKLSTGTLSASGLYASSGFLAEGLNSQALHLALIRFSPSGERFVLWGERESSDGSIHELNLVTP